MPLMILASQVYVYCLCVLFAAGGEISKYFPDVKFATDWPFLGWTGTHYQHGNIHHGWCAYNHGIWKIARTCSCLCRHGLGCRSHGGHATVLCWTIDSGGMENLCPRWEFTLKCSVFGHVNWSMWLGIRVWQIWAKVRIYLYMHWCVSLF